MGVIICLNGPPRSGKDTAASAISLALQAFHYKMSHPLKIAIPAFMGLEDRRLYLEENKDTPLPQLNGRTFRELQIGLSELWAKPLMGSSVFGQMAANNIRGHVGPNRVAVISDCGFAAEVPPLLKVVGQRNVLILQLVRDGCTFENDSRSYIEVDGVDMIQLHNKYDVETFKAQVVRAVERWMDQTKGPR